MPKKKKKKDNAVVWVGAGLLAWWLFGPKKAGAITGGGSGGGSGGGRKVSKYYWESDVQHSDTARNEGINEQFQPLGDKTLENAKYYAEKVLDPLSDWLGYKVPVDSWWRSETLNDRVGGEPTSLHRFALASDVIQDDILQDYMRGVFMKQVPFHKMIISGTKENPTAVHISLKRTGNKRQVLGKDKNGNYYPIGIDDLLEYLGLTSKL